MQLPAKIKRALLVFAAGLNALLACASHASADDVDMTPIEDGSVKWTIHPDAFKVNGMSLWLPESKTSKEIHFARDSYYRLPGCFMASQWIPLEGPTAMMVFPNMTMKTTFYDLDRCGEKCYGGLGFDVPNPSDASVVKDMVTFQIEVDNGTKDKTYSYKVTTRGMSYKARSGQTATYDLTRKTAENSADPLVFHPVVEGTRFRVILCDLAYAADLYLRGVTVLAYPIE